MLPLFSLQCATEGIPGAPAVPVQSTTTFEEVGLVVSDDSAASKSWLSPLLLLPSPPITGAVLGPRTGAEVFLLQSWKGCLHQK